MRTVLADAGYWIAILNPADALRVKAVSLSNWRITSTLNRQDLLPFYVRRGSGKFECSLCISRQDSAGETVWQK